MTIKRVSEYQLFATGDACQFSMGGTPKYMLDDLTQGKIYPGYISHVEHDNYNIVITNDVGAQVKVWYEPSRPCYGLPTYRHVEVLLDKETYDDRVKRQQKRAKRYEEEQHVANLARHDELAAKRFGEWEKLIAY